MWRVKPKPHTVNLFPHTDLCALGMMEALSEEMRVSQITGNQKSRIKFTTIYPIMVDTGLVKNPRNRWDLCNRLCSGVMREVFQKVAGVNGLNFINLWFSCRFPILLGLLSPEKVASIIVKSIRREYKEVSIPRSMLTMDRLSR